MAPLAREPGQKGINWSNIAVGGIMNMVRLPPPSSAPILHLTNLTVRSFLFQFEVTTLGQPLEVLKTQMAANRTQTMGQAIKTVWSRGGVFGFYQGLIPWVRPPFRFLNPSLAYICLNGVSC